MSWINGLVCLGLVISVFAVMIGIGIRNYLSSRSQ